MGHTTSSFSKFGLQGRDHAAAQIQFMRCKQHAKILLFKINVLPVLSRKAENFVACAPHEPEYLTARAAFTGRL
jgi:hypothetical protein